LIKVKADATQRGQVLDVTEMYRARIADVGTETLIVEVTGEHDKIESMIEVLQPFGILEIMRTGKIAMARGVVKPRPGAQQPVLATNGKQQ
jgi:acetolactate synthase-1/3 small subunit